MEDEWKNDAEEQNNLAPKNTPPDVHVKKNMRGSIAEREVVVVVVDADVVSFA